MRVEVAKTFVEKFPVKNVFVNLVTDIFFFFLFLFFFFSGLLFSKSGRWSPWVTVFSYQPVHGTRLNRILKAFLM